MAEIAILSRVRAKMEPLKPLDLSKHNTVSDLVEGMSHCSFGARMLGEVAGTLVHWISSGYLPILVYEGRMDSPLGILLQHMRDTGWFGALLTTEDFARIAGRDERVVVVGPYPERAEAILNRHAAGVIFINQYGEVVEGAIADGHFPNVVFGDPRFIMPVLSYVICERLRNAKGREDYTVSALMKELHRYGGLAREVAEGTETLRRAVEDPLCTLCLTLSGAMTVAKMGLLICEMVDRGMVDYISSTGALMAHGLVEGIGLRHYKYDPAVSDEVLAEQKINRVTDTLEPEENFDHIEEVVNSVLEGFDGREPICPSLFHRAVGKYLAKHFPEERGILKSAYERNVPICVPAFVDSEIGNDLYVHNLKRKALGRPPLLMDVERDTELLVDLAVHSERLGIFSIGGGVPRNNTQNVTPLLEIINTRDAARLPVRKFFYGCRIDPTPLYYGSLSGCSYSEGGSWRKVDFSGRFSEIHADATIVWPFMLKCLIEQMER